MNNNPQQPVNLFETRDVLQYSLFAIGIIAFFLITQSINTAQPAPVTETKTVQQPASLIPYAPKVNPFQDLRLLAKAAIVLDATTGKTLYEMNPDIPFPLASLTKLMTALAATETPTPQNQTVTISEQALATEGNSGLYVNEKWSLQKLIQYMLVVSSNDGAKALALTLGAYPTPEHGDGTPRPSTDTYTSFITRMNAIGARLGLRNTNFNNATGLDETAIQGGSYGSARDMGTLLSYLYKHNPELLVPTRYSATTITSIDGIEHPAKNTNTVVESIPGIRGSKTGYTDLAGGNLAVVFDASFGEPVVIIVLGSTPEGRFTDTLNLARAARIQLSLDVKE